MPVFRTLIIAVVLAIASFGSVALAQTEKKTTEQQSSQDLTPLLGQITSRSCPELASAEIEKAALNISNFQRKIPDDIQELLMAWLDYSKYYKHLHYGISISIIVFGALATALEDDKKSWWKRWKTMAAILATIAAGVNTTLAPNIDYKKFDEAFVVLNTAKAAYMTNPNVTLCDVGKAVAHGESLIHKGE